MTRIYPYLKLIPVCHPSFRYYTQRCFSFASGISQHFGHLSRADWQILGGHPRLPHPQTQHLSSTHHTVSNYHMNGGFGPPYTASHQMVQPQDVLFNNTMTAQKRSM